MDFLPRSLPADGTLPRPEDVPVKPRTAERWQALIPESAPSGWKIFQRHKKHRDSSSTTPLKTIAKRN